MPACGYPSGKLHLRQVPTDNVAMKVLNLQCAHQHGFEGWFASDEDFLAQRDRGLIGCPVCGDTGVVQLPSAPRLNLGVRAEPGNGPSRDGSPVQAQAAHAAQALWLRRMRQVIDNTEDVGARFAEEARRMHYGEAQERNIRGKASRDETEALLEEGIPVLPLPIPEAFEGPIQ